MLMSGVMCESLGVFIHRANISGRYYVSCLLSGNCSLYHDVANTHVKVSVINVISSGGFEISCHLKWTF